MENARTLTITGVLVKYVLPEQEEKSTTSIRPRAGTKIHITVGSIKAGNTVTGVGARWVTCNASATLAGILRAIQLVLSSL
jgi:hypothetical protein